MLEIHRFRVGTIIKDRVARYLEREIEECRSLARSGGTVDPAHVLQELLDRIDAGFFDEKPEEIDLLED